MFKKAIEATVAIFQGKDRKVEYTVWTSYIENQRRSGNMKPLRYVFAEHFCNDKPSADKLYQLVIDGKKRATTGSVWAYEHDGEPLLNPGDLTILTNYDESKACIIRTTSVIVKKFNEITMEEARKEGEGDLSLAYWRKVHKEYFEEECNRIGREFSDEMPVAYEEFEIEYSNE
jgi:uncharacterized protein YhfF